MGNGHWNQYARRHIFDTRYFQNIDTPEKAYWLGMLTADGNVSDRGTITLQLKESDLAHVELFAKAIKHPALPSIAITVLKNKRHVGYKILANSKEMAADLKECGVTPRKSLTVSPWGGPSHLMKHYWRGVFDGDGSIYFDNQGQSWRASLCGSKPIVEGFRSFCQENRINFTANIHKSKNIFMFRLANKATRQLIEILYGDYSPCLARKASLVDKIREG